LFFNLHHIAKFYNKNLDYSTGMQQVNLKSPHDSKKIKHKNLSFFNEEGGFVLSFNSRMSLKFEAKTFCENFFKFSHYSSL